MTPAPSPGPAVLLASEGRPISREAVRRAARLGETGSGLVHVLVIARVWGTSLGFPNPGLNPSKREWDEVREIVARAVEALERSGLEARGEVIGTRGGAKLVVQQAQRLGCEAIVMGADPPRHRAVADFVWSQEPHRVERRARKTGISVHLVIES